MNAGRGGRSSLPVAVVRPSGDRTCRRFAFRAVIPCVLALCAVPLGAVEGNSPSVSREGSDGRADWRLPVSAVGSGSMPAGGEPLGTSARSHVAASSGAPAVPARDRTDGSLRTTTPARLSARPALGPIPSPTLIAGRPWQLWLRGRAADGAYPRIGARGLPSDARLEPTGEDGWHRLDWTPLPEHVGPLEITLIAMDRDAPRLTAESVLRLEIRPARRRSGIERAAHARGDGGDSLESPPAPLAAPTIEPLPMQIVSAGRVIRLKVRAHLDDGRSPQLTIDRLPASASFDANPDGSHTLYWPTRDVDRGDHRFRITARHPDDERRASGVDARITVGGSGVSTSQPTEPPVSIANTSSHRPLTVVGTLAVGEGRAGAAALDEAHVASDDAGAAYGILPGHAHDGASDPQAGISDDPLVSEDFFRETRLASPSSGHARGEIGPGGQGGGYFDPVDADAADAPEPDPLG